MSKQASETNNAHADTKNAAKKAAVLGTDRKNRLPLVVAILACALVAGAACVIFLRGSGGETPSVVASTDRVTYPAGNFQDGKARFFQVKTAEGKAVKFFVLRSSDGVIRAAFDACDVCWRSGLGYSQEGDSMVCRNCGQRFSSVKVNEVKGGCNPAPLRRSMEGSQVVIMVKDILEGGPYFDLPGRSRI